MWPLCVLFTLMNRYFYPWTSSTLTGGACRFFQSHVERCKFLLWSTKLRHRDMLPWLAVSRVDNALPCSSSCVYGVRCSAACCCTNKLCVVVPDDGQGDVCFSYVSNVLFLSTHFFSIVHPLAVLSH